MGMAALHGRFTVYAISVPRAAASDGFGLRNREEEGRSLSQLRIHPHSPLVPLDYLATCCQADSETLHDAVSMNAVEGLEYGIAVLLP